MVAASGARSVSIASRRARVATGPLALAGTGSGLKKGEAHPYSPYDQLPFGVDVFPGHKANDTVLWVESERAVISGDTLVEFGRGLELNERWLRPGVTREEIAAGLRPLLKLPVEHVLATHGGPTDRAALERALSSS
jgi:hypothetical protein